MFRRCVVFMVGDLLTVCIEMCFMTSEDYWKLTFSLYIVADLENLNSSLNCMPVLVIKLQLPNMTKETFKVLYLPSSDKNTCTCSKVTRHDFFELYTVVLGQSAHNAISYKTLTNLVVITVFFSLRVHCVFVSGVYITNNIKAYSVNDRQPIPMWVTWPIDLSGQ